MSKFVYCYVDCGAPYMGMSEDDTFQEFFLNLFSEETKYYRKDGLNDDEIFERLQSLPEEEGIMMTVYNVDDDEQVF